EQGEAARRAGRENELGTADHELPDGGELWLSEMRMTELARDEFRVAVSRIKVRSFPRKRESRGPELALKDWVPASAGTSGIGDLALAQSCGLHNRLEPAGGRLPETLPDPLRELVAHRAIGLEPLLARALGDGRIGGWPVFDVGRQCTRQLQRLVVRLGRER